MRSAFSKALNDVVILQKQNGDVVPDIKASVQDGAIYIFDASLAAEDGDTILRELPSGYVERFTILDTGFHTGLRGIPSHFQMQVRKETSLRKESVPAISTVYNLHGHNSRVNVSSTDNSNNYANVSADNVFTELKQALLAIADPGEQQKIIKTVEEMEQAKATPGFVQKYQNFIQQSANHMTLISPFIPMLTSLLTHGQTHQ